MDHIRGCQPGDTCDPDEHADLLGAIAATGHLAVSCSGCEDVLVLRVPTEDLREMLGVLARQAAPGNPMMPSLSGGTP